jgi:COMPASS component SWD3
VSNTCARAYRGHGSQKFCCFAAFGVHDSTVLAGGEDTCLHVWDLQSGAEVQTVEGCEPPSAGNAEAPTGAAAAPPRGDGHCDVVCAVDVHPLRRMVATGALDKDRTVKLWWTAAEAKGA